jgi:hypothetical protein
LTSLWKKASTLSVTSPGTAVRREKDKDEGWQNALQAICSQARKMQSVATDTRCQKRRSGDKEKAKGRNTKRKPTTCPKSTVTGLSVNTAVELVITKKIQLKFSSHYNPLAHKMAV